jgi:F0F1-type ATP synthase delta subunit
MADLTFRYSTPAQNIAALRERFRGANGVTAARIARWMLANLTDAQIKGAFDLTTGQVTALKARLQAKAKHLTDIEADTGE